MDITAEKLDISLHYFPAVETAGWQDWFGLLIHCGVEWLGGGTVHCHRLDGEREEKLGTAC